MTWRRRSWYVLLMAVILAAAVAPKPWIRELPWLWTLLTGTSLAAVVVACLLAGGVRALRLRSLRG